MGFNLYLLALETTRRCNMQCAHCMRGKSQYINLTEELVDEILNNKEIILIDSICFSGGEPTLNPKIIIYTINKIIEENIDVRELVMVTNGQIFDKELVEAFNRFNDYCNQRIKKSLQEKYKNFISIGEDFIDNQIKLNTDNHVRITFSTDKYHSSIKEETKMLYKKFSKGLNITEHSVSDDKVYRTGFANFGKEFNYKLEDLRYYQEKENYAIIDIVYLTATGYLTSEGMGQYSDMDRINMGHISEINLRDILIKYGKPIFNTEPIVKSKNVLVKKYPTKLNQD